MPSLSKGVEGLVTFNQFSMKKILFIFPFFASFLACAFMPPPHQEKTNVRNFLSSLPEEERILLDYFFRCLIQEDVIGYTLIHTKPMSFFSCLKPKMHISASPYEVAPLPRMKCLFEGFKSRYAMFHRGFEIWKRYEHLFCKKNIFFGDYEAEGDLSYGKVIIFNKKLLLPLINKHIIRFQEIDPSLKDPQSIFKALLKDEKFKEKFHSSTALVGICLGYGERNAVLFEKMIKHFSALGLYGMTLHSLEYQKAIKNELSSLKASFNGILQSHDSKKMLFSFGPSFRVDDTHPETHLLEKKYLQASKTLPQFYSNSKSFLENTLCLLIEADK